MSASKHETDSGKLERTKIELAKYNYVRFSVCDMNGVSRGQVVPVRNVDKYLKQGVDVFQGVLLFGSLDEVIVVDHEKGYEFGNMCLLPDLDTLRPIPWCGDEETKVAEMQCESYWRTDMSPQEACPRHLAKTQLQKLGDLGYELYSGSEIEFFLVNAETRKPISTGRQHMSHRNQSEHAPLLFDIDRSLLESGVHLEMMHSEYGPGMFEAILTPQYGIDSPDMTFNLKQGLMEIACKKGLTASFIPKLDKKESGVGAHFNFSVLSRSTGENVFFDAKESDHLSATAKHWIAGIMKHAKALCALNCPTVNCYRRLFQAWSPGKINWAIQDRFSFLRVKNHDAANTYMENRLPSGKSNPYLVLASTVAAGLDGIINKLECPPMDKDIDLLPSSLEEALEDLQKDQYMVDALGQELVTWFVKCKKEGDLRNFEGIEDDNERMTAEIKIYF